MRLHRRRGAPGLRRDVPVAVARIGHNEGPPLDEHVPEWGRGPIGTYFHWKAARRSAFRKVPHEVLISRARKAEALGLTYEEYTLEILERGRHLQREDTERIARIVAARK